MARLFASLLLSFTLAAAAEPAVLDASKAVALENVAWKVGDATLRIESGWAVPFASKDGAPLEVAFAGRATLECLPREVVESRYLAVFIGSPALSLEVDAAVLALGDPALAGRVLAGSAAQADPAASAAAEAFARVWRDSTERRGLGVELLSWRARFGDPVVGSAMALAVRSARFGTVHAAFDPEADEPFRLGRFVPLQVGDHDLDIARRYVGRERWEGRYLDLDVRDLGNWDAWVQYAPRGENGGAGFDVEAYTIDVRVLPGGEVLRGKADLRVRWKQPGRTTAAFTLFSDLKVQSVRTPAGRDLDFRQVGGSFAVALPEPSNPEVPLALEVTYEGAALEKDAEGYWWMRSTGGWYPRGGAARATFDVTLRHPRRLQLFSAGRRVDGGEVDGEAWERRVLDVPGLAFSFEVGRFDVLTDRYGDTELTFAFGKSPRSVPNDLQKSVAVNLKEALRSYEALFGKYPYPTLTFVTVPRGFSQGYPGFISFAHPILVGDPRYFVLQARGEAVETIAHELAHQWWGNKLGWRGYRDQWLSEALATYASTWFTFYRLNRDENYLRGRFGGVHGELNASSAAGRPVGQVGPVILGARLDSSLADAYAPVVYGKGALVFNALVYEVGEGAFLRMLRTLADEVNHGTIDTRTFFDAIEKMSGRDLGAFYRTFVEGTDLPEIEIEKVTVAPAEGGKWSVRGEVRVTPDARPRVVVRRDESDRWVVAPMPAAVSADLAIPRLVVPWSARAGKVTPAVTLDGTVALPVPGGTFEIVVPAEPSEFRLNALGSVFAGRSVEPAGDTKNGLMRRGMRRANEGRLEAAEADLRAALAAAPETGRDGAIQARYEDGGAHIGLARIALDRGLDDAARAHLRDAEEALGVQQRLAFRAERDLLESRLDLRAGKAEAAYDRLSRTLFLPFRQTASETTAQQARRAKFADGAVGTAESYAVLALAARLTGREEVAELAAREAEKRGADLSGLPQAAPAGGR